MPLKIDIKFEEFDISFGGKFFGKTKFIQGNDILDSAAITSLRKADDGWEIPSWDVSQAENHKWNPMPGLHHQFTSQDDDTPIAIEVVLFQFGSDQTPGRSSEPEHDFFKVASGQQALYPPKVLFKVNQINQHPKHEIMTFSRRLQLFTDKAAGDVRIFIGSITVGYQVTFKPQAEVVENKEDAVEIQREFNRYHHSQLEVPVIGLNGSGLLGSTDKLPSESSRKSVVDFDSTRIDADPSFALSSGGQRSLHSYFEPESQTKMEENDSVPWNTHLMSRSVNSEHLKEKGGEKISSIVEDRKARKIHFTKPLVRKMCMPNVSEKKKSSSSLLENTNAKQIDQSEHDIVPLPMPLPMMPADEEEEDKIAQVLSKADDNPITNEGRIEHSESPVHRWTESQLSRPKSAQKPLENDFSKFTSEPLPEFPSLDAVKDILPKYHSLVRSPPKSAASVSEHIPIQEPSFAEEGKTIEEAKKIASSSHQSTKNSNQFIQRPKTEALFSRPGTSLVAYNLDFTPGISDDARKTLDSHVVAVLDYQTKSCMELILNAESVLPNVNSLQLVTRSLQCEKSDQRIWDEKELDRYRVAIRKLGEDLLHLRKEVSRLETANSQLRAKVYYAEEYTESDKRHFEKMEGGQQIAHLNRKLLAEGERNSELTERLETVQNDLIKANEREKRHLKTQQAHQAQQSLVQQLQTKLSKYNLLEKTCKDQEKVIEELEKRFAKSHGNTNGIHVALNTPETSRQKKHVGTNHALEYHKGILKGNANGGFDSSDVVLRSSTDLHERLLLLHKLEKAEGRIMALEQQLSDNTRRWGKEKMALQFTGMNRAVDHYSSPFGKLTSPPLPSIEPNYQTVDRQPRYYGGYGRRLHSPYHYGQL